MSREEEDPGKRVRDLPVVLTPLTSVECKVYVERLQKRKAEQVQEAKRSVVLTPLTGEVCEACVEAKEAKRRRLERSREWKKANPDKVKAQKKRWRERNRKKLREREKERKKANREKLREQKRRWRQANPEKNRERQRKWQQANREKLRERKNRWQQANREKLRERKQRWRQANPEKVKEQKKRQREREKARLEGDEERLREARRKAREQKQRYRQANPEKLRERQKRWRQANPGKLKAQRERSREADRVRCRRYYEAHKEERNRARRERYYRQMGRPVPPPPPPPSPCDCGACLACGGWGATWQPAWHAQLKAFSAKKDQPLVALEELPLDLLESEAESLSTASTSEIDSEWGDRLETLLADESDSEVETGPATAPTRQSTRIAAMPAVSYQDWEEEENPMWEMLRRKAQLHAEVEDRIVTRWELLDRRTERVDAIVREMSVSVDPTRELDRFQAQLERQDIAMDVMVSEALFDFVDGQL